MIRAVIIDDEQHCIDRLSGLLAEHLSGSVQIAGCYNTMQTGIDGVRATNPGLIFLDVQLGEQTGFDLLRELGTIHAEVIFTTAYEQYAVKAFKFSALDYLLKPVDPTDLVQAVRKLNTRSVNATINPQLEVLLDNLRNMPGISRRICVPVTNGLEILQVSDITHCESDINYTTIFLSNRHKMKVAKTLKEFEEMLKDYNFYRVHNSHLINLAYIKSYNKGKGGFVTMTDNTVIEVSDRRKEEFLKRLALL